MDEKNNKKRVRTVQLLLNVASINSSFTGFGSGERNFDKDLFLIFIFIKRRAAVTGGKNSNSTTSTSATVACNLAPKPTLQNKNGLTFITDT